MKLCLIQISDLHLDSGGAGKSLMLPRQKRDELIRSQRRTLERVVELAVEDGAMALVVPGDLFDLESPASDTIALAREKFADLAPIPVLIAPGNHDFIGPLSPFNPLFLRAKGAGDWPPNVHIFGADGFETFCPPGLEGVCFTGLGVIRDTPLDERVLARKINLDPGRINVLVLHGSRLGSAPPGKMVTAPFTDAELLSQGFDYAALGHYHSFSTIIDSRGVVRGAYSGAAAGLGLDESGPKGGLWVEITKQDGKSLVELKPLDLGAVRIQILDISVTGCSHNEELRDRIAGSIAALSLENPGAVALALRFQGVYDPGLDRSLSALAPGGEFFHVTPLWDQARPGWNLESLASGPDTTESRFVREMRLRIESEQDPELKAQHRRALYYGIDALKLGRVDPGYEDLE